ncbi:NAD-binding protein [Candidatus Woesearchaeota archaeon]|nr:NAD-binding protein [Candidatus Woesearchaeota archaeon]
MKIMIVGGGEVGLTTANVLSTKEHDLVLIESDEKTAKKAANSIDALVIHGDGTDIATLKDGGVSDADAIVAATDDDKTNLMVCEISKSLGLKKIIARVNKSENEELFTKLGITGVVPTVGIAVTTIKNLIMEDRAERVVYELGKGEVQVLAITIPSESKLIGKAAEIKNAIIGVIYRNGVLILPKEGTKIEEGDVLVLTAQTKNMKSISKQIYGAGKWKSS